MKFTDKHREIFQLIAENHKSELGNSKDNFLIDNPQSYQDAYELCKKTFGHVDLSNHVHEKLLVTAAYAWSEPNEWRHLSADDQYAIVKMKQINIQMYNDIVYMQEWFLDILKDSSINMTTLSQIFLSAGVPSTHSDELATAVMRVGIFLNQKLSHTPISFDHEDIAALNDEFISKYFKLLIQPKLSTEAKIALIDRIDKMPIISDFPVKNLISLSLSVLTIAKSLFTKRKNDLLVKNIMHNLQEISQNIVERYKELRSTLEDLKYEQVDVAIDVLSTIRSMMMAYAQINNLPAAAYSTTDDRVTDVDYILNHPEVFNQDHHNTATLTDEAANIVSAKKTHVFRLVNSWLNEYVGLIDEQDESTCSVRDRINQKLLNALYQEYNQEFDSLKASKERLLRIRALIKISTELMQFEFNDIDLDTASEQTQSQQEQEECKASAWPLPGACASDAKSAQVLPPVSSTFLMDSVNLINDYIKQSFSTASASMDSESLIRDESLSSTDSHFSRQVGEIVQDYLQTGQTQLVFLQWFINTWVNPYLPSNQERQLTASERNEMQQAFDEKLPNLRRRYHELDKNGLDQEDVQWVGNAIKQLDKVVIALVGFDKNLKVTTTSLNEIRSKLDRVDEQLTKLAACSAKERNSLAAGDFCSTVPSVQTSYLPNWNMLAGIKPQAQLQEQQQTKGVSKTLYNK